MSALEEKQDKTCCWVKDRQQETTGKLWSNSSADLASIGKTSVAHVRSLGYNINLLLFVYQSYHQELHCEHQNRNFLLICDSNSNLTLAAIAAIANLTYSCHANKLVVIGLLLVCERGLRLSVKSSGKQSLAPSGGCSWNICHCQDTHRKPLVNEN